MLCNIAAAEFLMPVGAEIDPSIPVTIDNILRLQRQFEVSTEAISIRLVKVTNEPCAMFSTARMLEDSTSYVVNYSIRSRSSNLDIPRNAEIKGRPFAVCWW